MADKEKDSAGTGYQEIVLEAVKGIKNKILLYGIVVIALLVSAGCFGIQVLKTLEWPVIIIATLVLIAYFFNKGIPQARERLRKAAPDQQAGEASRQEHERERAANEVIIENNTLAGENNKIVGVSYEE